MTIVHNHYYTNTEIKHHWYYCIIPFVAVTIILHCNHHSVHSLGINPVSGTIRQPPWPSALPKNPLRRQAHLSCAESLRSQGLCISCLYMQIRSSHMYILTYTPYTIHNTYVAILLYSYNQCYWQTYKSLLMKGGACAPTCGFTERITAVPLGFAATSQHGSCNGSLRTL